MAKSKPKILWSKLLISIVIAQAAGAIGTIFTISAIPTWYALLNKPVFSPPNWLFGPVWTVLYTLIGISLYLIWTNKKGQLKLFMFHLFLNAIWSPIFFGAKNLGLAFLVILVMDTTLIVIIKNFYKINKVAGIILIPYLIWISFASILNLAIWQLNPNTVNAQDFNFTKAREDYIFTEDNYKKDLFDFNLKKGAYQKNPTLSLKEELRLSLFKFISSRNSYTKSYINMLRAKTTEAIGLKKDVKETVYTKLDPEVIWFESRKNDYNEADKLEDLISKTKEEDLHYKSQTLPSIYFALAYNNIGKSIEFKNKHFEIYSKLKDESQNLVGLGRADSELFNRWFIDIDKELNLLSKYENESEVEILKIFSDDEYQRDGAYKKSGEKLSPSKDSLIRLNGYILELENVISSKR